MRVVLDTNIYISAILFVGNCEEILRLATLGSYELFISNVILKEIKGILEKKFHWTRKQVNETLSYIREIAIIIKPVKPILVIKKDPSDDKIIECALAAHADFIVTGDKAHVLPLKRYERIKILSPADFLKL